MRKKQQQVKVAQPYLQAEIKFDRGNATYKPEQFISGQIIFLKKSNPQTFDTQIVSLNFRVHGQATIHNRHNKKQIQYVRNMADKITFIDTNIEVAIQKTITNDNNSIPFKFKLSKGDHKFIQTYTGVYINIAYSINMMVNFRQYHIEPINQQTPFYVQVPQAGRQVIQNFKYPKPKYFMFRSQNVKGDVQPHHKFKIRGQLQSQIVYFNDYLNGKITVDICQSPIRSIDLQMLRNEKIQTNGRTYHETTQIQMIQICDGDVTRNLQLPIYMILPRYYSCPSVVYKWINVTFQINLIVAFRNGYKVTANIPLKLIRS